MREGDQVRVLGENGRMPDGACEGMVGTVTAIEYDPGDDDPLVHVELPESPFGSAEFMESELEVIRP